MATLTIQNITWACFKHEGKTAFGHNAHAIVAHSGYYLLKEKGETVFVGKNVVECLEVAHEYVLEYHASQIVPSWETSDPFTSS